MTKTKNVLSCYVQCFVLFQITDLLETEPFPALNPDQKAGVLASMVNELVCSKPVCDEIDNHLENLATLRRDKWIVEGKIRQ